MQGKASSFKLIHILKPFLTILGLILFVLLVNQPVIHFNMMYPEQPLLFIANQKINSLWDLINIYLHPQMMHFTIPFFRPSGHFLMYQILTPFLGWHNFQAFLIVNLIFLALSGFLIIRLYDLLFPGLRFGGYIAFAFYAMHPALILSRFISLHFEFAYVFFLLWSLYCFALWCQRNKLDSKKNIKEIQAARPAYGWLLVCSIGFYIIATSFKESALMLGPVLGVYLCVAMYSHERPVFFLKAILFNRHLRSVLCLLGIISLTLAVYLTLPWPTLSNPVRAPFDSDSVARSFNYFFYSVFNINLFKVQALPNLIKFNMWETIRFPYVVLISIWVLFAVMAIAIMSAFKRAYRCGAIYSKPIFFLLTSSIVFLIIPMGWGMGYAWHFSLTILMLSFLIGFGVDYLLNRQVTNPKIHLGLCASVALIVGLQAITVNMAAIHYYGRGDNEKLIFNLLQNAIINAPLIQSKLTPTSFILIEDSIIEDAYVSGGGGVYPFLAFSNKAFANNIIKKTANALLPYDPNYNGSLFRYAYLQPYLLETTYPFKVEEMMHVGNEMLYQWLRHSEDIFCLGYDSQGNWHDKTVRFKEKLLEEKRIRKIMVSHYKTTFLKKLQGEHSDIMVLSYPDPQLCQYNCDQNESCKGFTYVNYKVGKKEVANCEFSDNTDTSEEPCVACTAYVKT